MKKGPPMSEVIIPTGISAGANTTLAIVSQMTRNIPPKRSDAGAKYRWSEPTSKRHI